MCIQQWKLAARQKGMLDMVEELGSTRKGEECLNQIRGIYRETYH